MTSPTPSLVGLDVARLRRLASKLNGPWKLSEDGAIVDAFDDEVTALCNRAGDPDCRQEDAEALVALVNASPALLAAVEEVKVIGDMALQLLTSPKQYDSACTRTLERVVMLRAVLGGSTHE